MRLAAEWHPAACLARAARPILAAMPRRPVKPPQEPPQPASLPRRAIHKAAHRLIWVGEVAAADEAAAIAKAAEQLGLLPAKLIATRRP